MFSQLIPIPAFAVVDVSFMTLRGMEAKREQICSNPTLDTSVVCLLCSLDKTGFAYEVTLKLFAAGKHSPLVRIH